MNDPSRWISHRRYLYLLAKIVFFGLLLYISYTIWGMVSPILGPLALSLLIAYLLDPFVDWFEERGINRTLAISIMTILALGTFSLFILVVTPTLVDEITDLATNKIPRFIKNIGNEYVTYNAMLKERTGYALPVTFDETFQNYGQKLQEYIGGAAQKVTQFTGDVLSGTWTVVSSLLNLALIPLFVFYLLRDFDEMKETIRNLIPLPVRGRVIHKVKRVDDVVGHWFRGQLLVASILAVLYTFGLGILQVKLWFAIGLFAGLMSVVPYLGFIVGIGLALLMSVLDDGTGWGQIIGVFVVFGVVQTMEGYIITPKVVGEKVGLGPLTVIVVLLLGQQLAGLLGILLSIPVAGAIRVFLLDTIADYKRSRFFLGEDNYLKLLTLGSEQADEEVREALRQAAEGDLDMELPEPLSKEEVQRLSVAVMRSKSAYGVPEVFQVPERMDRAKFRETMRQDFKDFVGDGEPDEEAQDDLGAQISAALSPSSVGAKEGDAKPSTESTATPEPEADASSTAESATPDDDKADEPAK